MTGRDIVLNQLAHRETKPIPYTLGKDIYGSLWRMDRRPFHLEEGGGFILSTAKGLQPETPTGDAAAVVESLANQE